MVLFEIKKKVMEVMGGTEIDEESDKITGKCQV